MAVLCVNIDHIATVREARKINEPDPIAAAVIAELAGARGITVHLREDRRHIQERDLALLRQVVKTKLNLEMAATREMTEIALKYKPDMATLVPERREEVTTEGGLNVAQNLKRIKNVVTTLQSAGIPVSLFIEPKEEQIRASKQVGAKFIELHTGLYVNAKNEDDVARELQALQNMAKLAKELGLRVNAGHGLNYRNVIPVAAIPEIEDLNIGHSIITYALFVGVERAVREMVALINQARQAL